VLRLGIICFISVALPISAQIFNVEKIRLDYPEDKVLFGNIGANLTYHNRTLNQRTPTRVLTGGLTGDVGYFSDNHLYMLISNFQWLYVNEVNIVNFGSTHVRTQLYHKSPVSPEFYGQHQYDEARGLTLRLLAGGGPRWRIIKNEAFNLALGSGLMYEAEDWRDIAATNQAVTYARYIKSSSYVSARYLVNTQVDSNAVIYYQVGYDQNYSEALHRISGEINLAFKLFERVSFTVALNAAWESRPIIPILPLVFNVTNGVRFKF